METRASDRSLSVRGYARQICQSSHLERPRIQSSYPKTLSPGGCRVNRIERSSIRPSPHCRIHRGRTLFLFMIHDYIFLEISFVIVRTTCWYLWFPAKTRFSSTLCFHSSIVSFRFHLRFALIFDVENLRKFLQIKLIRIDHGKRTQSLTIISPRAAVTFRAFCFVRPWTIPA